MEKARTTAAVPAAQETVFLIIFRSEEAERLARIVIEGLRTFGGPLADSRVFAFVLDPDRAPNVLFGMDGIRRIPLAPDESDPPYAFAEKVYASARAEEMAGPEIGSLVWLSLDCLVVNPPLLFDLGAAPGVPPADAAFRPVHHQNVGSPVEEPMDDFWTGIYQALGVQAMPYTIESFADRRMLRPYFNTHCFAWNPATELGRAWWESFQGMVSDEGYQARACRDELHQVLLHQAILSTLVPTVLAWDRIRMLPPEYNYPLNLQGGIPADLQAATLNNLVNAVYEAAFPWGSIEVREPLHSWLRERLPGAEGA